MSTRCTITVVDKYAPISTAGSKGYSLYKHYDGYPGGIVYLLAKAQAGVKHWGIHRREADDFAAAIVAENKNRGGDVLLSKGPQRHGDLDYAYVVYPALGENKQVLAPGWQVDVYHAKWAAGDKLKFVKLQTVKLTDVDAVELMAVAS